MFRKRKRNEILEKYMRKFRCERQCPHGHFGERCEEVCQCENGASCEPVSGHCQCAPGWRGRKCNRRKCSKWSFCRLISELLAYLVRLVEVTHSLKNFFIGGVIPSKVSQAVPKFAFLPSPSSSELLWLLGNFKSNFGLVHYRLKPDSQEAGEVIR